MLFGLRPAKIKRRGQSANWGGLLQPWGIPYYRLQLCSFTGEKDKKAFKDGAKALANRLSSILKKSARRKPQDNNKGIYWLKFPAMIPNGLGSLPLS